MANEIGGKRMNFNVALLQILPKGSQEANLCKGLEYCNRGYYTANNPEEISNRLDSTER